MNLSVSHPASKVALVSFQNDALDASNVKAFREAMTPVVLGHAFVLLDMSGLKFVDSSGLGALLSCLRNMNNKSGELRLFGLTASVMALFELVRMHRIFAIYNTREEALEGTAEK
jgi:anti-sigma B factor antagonist